MSPKEPEPSKEKEAESQLEQNTEKLDGNRDAETQEVDRGTVIEQFREHRLQSTVRDVSKGRDQQVEGDQTGGEESERHQGARCEDWFQSRERRQRDLWERQRKREWQRSQQQHMRKTRS